jgi:glycosyltransferase involved in cell wall biosynthesis
MPEISVIVTTFNRLAGLRRCVESVLCQTFDDFELIVVDDASTDATAEFAASVSDPRFRFCRMPTNCGAPAKPRNAGAALARAPLLFIFDSDDTLLPGALGLFVEAFRGRPGLGMAWSWKNLLDPDGRVVEVERRDRLTREPLLPLALVYAPGANGLALRSEVFRELGGFDEAMPRMDDYEFALRFCAAARWELDVLRDVTMNVHCDGGGHISASPTRTLLAREHVLAKHRSLFERYPQQHARHLFQVAQLRLSVRGDRWGFASALAQSLRRDPKWSRALALWRLLPGSSLALQARHARRPGEQPAYQKQA